MYLRLSGMMLLLIILSASFSIGAVKAQNETTTNQTTPTQPACEDRLSTCGLLDPTFYCVGDFASWAYDNCRLTCKMCNGYTTPLPTKGCEHGHTWIDRCKYKCTCDDGQYRCTNYSCPQYTNLPPGCTLEKQPGECCDQPVCGGTYPLPTVPVPSKCYSSIIKRYTFKPVRYQDFSCCQYKGQYYAQDETWKEGCSQNCTCTDGTNGMYSCRAVCINWPTLPSVCHLEDPSPGLCCQQPRCPSSIVITIPYEYKDEYPGYKYVEALVG